MNQIAFEKFSQDLSLGALSFEWTAPRDLRLLEVLAAASVNITETFKVIHVDGVSANYNVTLDTVSLVAQNNFVFRPTGKKVIKRGDKIKVTCTNANLTGVLYGKILCEEI